MAGFAGNQGKDLGAAGEGVALGSPRDGMVDHKAIVFKGVFESPYARFVKQPILVDR